MFIYLACWYFFTIVTYGVWVPAGLFLPGMIIGCALGSLYETILESIFTLDGPDHSPVLPVVVGAGAMLAGYTHLTYSLLVIMLETTSSINLFIPMMIGIMTSRGIAKLFTRSLYERALRTKQSPMLRGHIPKETIHLKIKSIMVSDVQTLPSVADMKSIRACFDTTHSAWPVLNVSGNLCGVMPKNILVKLI
jgi:hypothetical protein